MIALDAIGPDSHPERAATHFRAIITARRAAQDAEAQLRDAVTVPADTPDGGRAADGPRRAGQ